LPRPLELRRILEPGRSLELGPVLELSWPPELRRVLELRRAGKCALPRRRELAGKRVGLSTGESAR
jgi:hypothetical protein